MSSRLPESQQATTRINGRRVGSGLYATGVRGRRQLEGVRLPHPLAEGLGRHMPGIHQRTTADRLNTQASRLPVEGVSSAHPHASGRAAPDCQPRTRCNFGVLDNVSIVANLLFLAAGAIGTMGVCRGAVQWTPKWPWHSAGWR